jgi:tight adherence protein C
VTAATALAAAAGAIAAAGITELARGWTPRRRPVLRALAARALARAGARLTPPRDLPARLAAAGLDVAPVDVMAAKLGLAALGLLATLALAPPLAPLTAAGAFLAPDLLIRRRARARAETIEAELADVLDLLRVATAAGLSPARALGEVGRRHHGTLAQELDRAARTAALGVPLTHALAALGRRAGLQPLVATLERATRHGAPLGPSLAAQAQDARAHTARRATEHAARAAPQVQLVVALLLVPSVLLLVAAALIPA